MSFDPRVLALVGAAIVGAWGGAVYEKAKTQTVRLEFAEYKLKAEKSVSDQRQKNLDDYVTQAAKIKEAEDASRKRIETQERKFLASRDKWVADRLLAQSTLDKLLATPRPDSLDSDRDAIADGLLCRISRPAVVEKAREYDKIVEAFAVCKAYVESLPRPR